MEVLFSENEHLTRDIAIFREIMKVSRHRSGRSLVQSKKMRGQTLETQQQIEVSSVEKEYLIREIDHQGAEQTSVK